MIKKLVSTCAVALSAALLLTACGTSQGSGAKTAETVNPSTQAQSVQPQTKEKVKLRLATWAGQDEAKELQGLIDKINASATTYELTQDSNPADFDTRITTQLSGNDGPDLFWISAARGAQLAAKGTMLDITDKLAASDKPAAQVSDYFESSFAPFKIKDKIYALPWIMQPVVMYVNSDMFTKAGVALPDATWNWAKFLDAANKLTTDKNGKHPGESGFDAKNIQTWGFTLNGWPPVQMFVWQAGGEVIAPDFSSSPIDSAAAKTGIKFYADLVNSPVVPSQQTIRDRGFDTMFKNGQVAMFMGGAADSLETKVTGFKAIVAEVPAGPTGIKADFVDLLGMGINSKTKDPGAAFDALADLTNEIHGWKVMPPRKSLATVENMVKQHPDRKDSFQAIINSMSYTRPFQFYENYPDWDSLFWTQLMDPIVNNHGDLEKLIPPLKPQLDEKLK